MPSTLQGQRRERGRGVRRELQLVPLPRHVRPLHALHDDDADQLVLAGQGGLHRVHLGQHERRLGQGTDGFISRVLGVQ